MHDETRSLVSVIVPVYNVERYVDQCLSSIRGQTHRALEIICINDGSTDGSLEILRRHAREDRRIVVVDKENEGYGAGCNLGIERARGAWVSIVEPDDWIEPGMYADMLALAAAAEGRADVVKTPWTDVVGWDDPAATSMRPSVLCGRIETSPKPFSLKDHPELIELHPSIWSAIYRRDFLDELGIRFRPYPGAGWADNPFLVETLCQAEGILFLDKAYYNYRADLTASRSGPATEEAIARPFDRWIEMLQIMDDLGMTDQGIVAAHYFRGFQYASAAVRDFGQDNPVVQANVRKMFALMEERIVVDHPKLSRKRKRFYFETLGKRPPALPLLPYLAHLAREAAYTLRVLGVSGVVGRISRG